MHHTTLSLAILLTSTAAAQFGTARVVTEGDQDYPRVVISADINGDGHIDLVGQRNGSGASVLTKVLWWANDGAGVFGDAQVLLNDLPNNFSLQGFADLDGDGFSDLIGASSSNVTWWRNTGGALAAATPLYSGALSSFAVGDLDGDGDPDIVGRTSAMQVLLNDGTGAFTPGPVLSAASGNVNSVHLQVADLNGDGTLDVLVGGDNPWRGWYVNQGGGNFSALQTIPGFSLLFTPRLGDIDGDGDLELLACGQSPGIRVFNNDGLGTFTLADTLALGNMIPDVVTDIDEDGLADMTKATTTTCNVIISHNNGNGTFSDQQLEMFNAYSLQGTRYAVADLDGDGDQDVAFVHGQGLMGWFAQEGPGQWSARRRVSWTTSATRDLASADFDGDGTPDLVAASEYASMVTLYRNDGTGEQFQRSIIAENFDRVVHVDAADIDGDGDIDVVASNTTEAKWFANNGDATAWTAHTIPGAAGAFSMGDVDGDGQADLMFQGLLYRNEGGSFLAEEVLAGALFGSIKDMNGDGDPDLLIYHSGGFTVATNDGSGSFTFTSYASTLGLSFVAMADMNGDGQVDIIGRITGNIMVCMLLDGNGGLQVDTITTDLPQSTDGTIACVDLDLDGDMDIMWSRSYGYTHQSYSIENLGNMAFGGNTLVDPSAEVTRKFLFTDLDGDGLFDLAVGRHHSIRWYPNLYPNPFRLKGAVFLDANEDGVRDPAEAGIPYILVKSNGQQAMTWSNSSGTFNIPSSPGTWQISSPLQPFTFATTPDTLTTTLNAATLAATGLDFGRQLMPADPTLQYNTSDHVRCDTEIRHWIQVKNTGGSPLEAPLLDVHLESGLIFLASEPAPDSIVGQHYFWSWPTIGPMQQRTVQLDLMTGPVGSFASMGITLSAEEVEDVATGFQQPVTCAYDPNDKQVLPVGHGEFHAVDIDTPWLDYTVRFQNTGNDTAFVVVIEDMLDADLDPSTMQVLATSHTITDIHLDDGNTLLFRYDGILLPDSNVDPLGSNGHVRYRIRPYADRPHATEIHNTAAILFDQNPPVITNTTLTTLVDCGLFSATITEGNASLLASEGVAYQWFLDGDTIPGATEQTILPDWSAPGVYTVAVTSVYGCVAVSDPYTMLPDGIADQDRPRFVLQPNPATDQVRLLADRVLQAEDQVLLMDLHGRVLRTVRGGGLRELVLAREGLAAGVYLVELRRAGTAVGRVRVVWR